MDKIIAKQIANLINSENHLVNDYTPERILNKADQFITRMEGNLLIAVVRVRKLHWYQSEISCLSVLPTIRRLGIGREMIINAEAHAREIGSHIVQCTIREDNIPSSALFMKSGYTPSITFKYPVSGHHVKIYQKALSV